MTTGYGVTSQPGNKLKRADGRFNVKHPQSSNDAGNQQLAHSQARTETPSERSLKYWQIAGGCADLMAQ
jgi:hypothetical protein